MNENGQPPKVDPPPILPWGIDLNNSYTHFWPEFGEQGELVRMTLVFSALVVSPQGQAALMPPQVKIFFSPEGWANFKKLVERDGETPPQIPIARTLPPEMRT